MVTEEAKKWLTDNYESKKNSTEVISISEDTELEGELIIDGYPKLKSIFLDNAKKITQLKIDNCPDVEIVFVSDNQITKIEGLEKLTKLKRLSFGSNQIKEIDISKNTELEILVFFKNPSDLKFLNGIKNLSKLIIMNSDDTFAVTTLLNQASEKDLKEIAGKLNLNVDGKDSERMKKDIIDEIDKINQNHAKLNGKFPNLISDKNELDNGKLEKIKEDSDKGEKYQKLVDEKENDPIKDTAKKEIDQNKLKDVLGKAAEYDKLVTKNPNLVDNGKIDQGKIDQISQGSKDTIEQVKALEKALKTIVGPNYRDHLNLNHHQNQVQQPTK